MMQRSQLGFSLIEMAMVVSILGVMVAGALTISKSNVEQKAALNTARSMDVLEDALQKYLEYYGRYPCPASPSAAESSAVFGVETNCSSSVTSPSNTWEAGTGVNTIRGGVVPVRTLGIPDRYMYDEWGSRVGFVVVKALATTLADYSGYTTALTTGVIQVTDVNGNQVVGSNANNVVAYLLVSYGKDKKGAYARKINATNSPDIACGTTAKDSENCDGDTSFIDSIPKDSQVASNYYYDYVRWALRKRLVDAKSGYMTINAVTHFSSGAYHTCLIKDDYSLWCWGDNTYGQLGDGTNTDSKVPVAVNGTYKWKSIATGYTNHTCAIKDDNTLWCWGDNTSGQLGDGTYSQRNVPTPVSGGGVWKTVSASGAMTCAIKSDDSLWCWGLNNIGQLGIGTTVNMRVPTAVSAGTSFQYVTVGENTACAAKLDNTIMCWGYNGGRFGNGSTANSATPVVAMGGASFLMFKTGQAGSCGIKTDKTLVCSGDNTYGQMGDDSTVTKTTPTQVSGGGTWQALALTGPSTCAVKSDNLLYCWGANVSGELGDGTLTNRSVPTAVSGSYNWTQLAAGGWHMCGRRTDKAFLCWGDNSNGQIGDGTLTTRTSPVLVTNF